MGRDITRCSEAELRELKAELDRQYAGYVAQNLKLDMSRGKPSGTQLNLTNGILDKLDSYVTGDGVDARNYGGLEGIPEARRLFWEYLANILEGGVPARAVAVACEYIGDCRPASRAEELELLLRRLQAGTVERSYNLFRGYPLYNSLEAFYRTLRRRAEKQLPCLVRLTQRPGGQKLSICRDADLDRPFLCWGPLRDYGPPGLMHIQAHGARCLAAPTEDCAILLPDRSLPLFRQAFAGLILAVYGPSTGLDPA